MYEVLVNGVVAGNCAIISQRGVAVSCAHVIGRGARAVELLDRSGNRYQVEGVELHWHTDVAILKLPEELAARPGLRLCRGRSDELDIMYVGSAMAYRFRIPGRVAMWETTSDYHGGTRDYIDVAYVSAPCPFGVSGGPWIDTNTGAIVGIATGRIVESGDPTGIASVIPSDIIFKCLESACRVDTPTLGARYYRLTDLTYAKRRQYPREIAGVYLETVNAAGPLGRSGISDGDVLMSIAGVTVTDYESALQVIRSHEVGDSVEVRCYVASRKRWITLVVELGLVDGSR